MRTRIRAFVTAALLLTVATTSNAADIVDTAVSAGKFKTLATALQAADLVGALKGEGPFTVFAPTDEAFAKLPAGTVEALLKQENKSKLAGVLTYHVVPGQVMAGQVVKLSGAKTLNGQQVNIKTEGATVMIDGATVVTTDIKCDNGVIHIIDSVILPEDKNIPAVAANAGNFGTLLAAAKAAGLVDALSGTGPLTVFAPTDEAFSKLPEGTVKALLLPENKQKLATILKYHVVAGRVYAADALKAKTATTLHGGSVSISTDDRGAFVNDAQLMTTDIDASNGVIHLIDRVILPPQKTATNSTSAPSATTAMHTIEDAVARGSALFNSGHHHACADVYSATMHGLMKTTVDQNLKNHMSSVLAEAGRHHDPTEKAWALRRGIDQMYTILASAR